MEQSRKDASYMKKKLLICLAMLVCILGLAGCGQEMTENSFITKDQAKETGEALCEQLASLNQMLAVYGVSMSEYVEMSGGNPEDAALDIAAMNSWVDASEEFGNFVSVLSDETEVTITEDKADVKVKIQGDKTYKGSKQRTATMEVVMTEKGFDSISVSTDYDMSELMTKAALNTVLGMGTVFAVLILISLLISCFNFIPKIQEKFRKKPAQTQSAPAPAKAEPVAVIQEETDDTELIAVIAAAIAASEGAVSADGYVVRSIIRR